MACSAIRLTAIVMIMPLSKWTSVGKFQVWDSRPLLKPLITIGCRPVGVWSSVARRFDHEVMRPSLELGQSGSWPSEGFGQQPSRARLVGLGTCPCQPRSWPSGDLGKRDLCTYKRIRRPNFVLTLRIDLAECTTRSVRGETCAQLAKCIAKRIFHPNSGARTSMWPRRALSQYVCRSSPSSAITPVCVAGLTWLFLIRSFALAC